jgi:hypothetical protein
MTDHLDFGGDRREVSFEGWHYSGATVLLAIAVYLAFRLSREALPVENPRLVDRLMGLTGLLVLISLAGGPSFFLLSGIGCFRAYGRAGLPALALWCVAAPVILHAALGRTRRGWVRPAAFVVLLVLSLLEGFQPTGWNPIWRCGRRPARSRCSCDGSPRRRIGPRKSSTVPSPATCPPVGGPP